MERDPGRDRTFYQPVVVDALDGVDRGYARVDHVVGGNAAHSCVILANLDGGRTNVVDDDKDIVYGLGMCTSPKER